MGIAVSTYRHKPVEKADEELRRKLVEWAGEKRHFGYWRLQVLLQRNGEQVNYKRIARVYRGAGLSVKRTKRNRLVRERSEIAAAVRTKYPHADRGGRLYAGVPGD